MKENVEGVGLMILEELKLLKSFGASLDGTVTETDLSAKEQELGIPLPEALRELYLTGKSFKPSRFWLRKSVPMAQPFRRSGNMGARSPVGCGIRKNWDL